MRATSANASAKIENDVIAVHRAPRARRARLEKRDGRACKQQEEDDDPGGGVGKEHQITPEEKTTTRSASVPRTAPLLRLRSRVSSRSIARPSRAKPSTRMSKKAPRPNPDRNARVRPRARAASGAGSRSKRARCTTSREAATPATAS